MPQWVTDIGKVICQVTNDDVSEINSCNANWYVGEKEDLYWHQDDEDLFRTSDSFRDVRIFSISFGVTRDFGFRIKYSHDHQFVSLRDGDIMTMEGIFQDKYQHCLFPGSVSEPVQEPVLTNTPINESLDFNERFNLTFRLIKRHNKGCACRPSNAN